MSTLISPGCYCLLLLLLLLLDSSSKQLFMNGLFNFFSFFFCSWWNDSLNVGVSKSCRMHLSSIFFFLSTNQGNYFLKRNFSGSSEQGRYCNDDDIAFVCRFQIFLKRKSLEFSLRFVIFSSSQHVHGYGVVRDFKSDSPLRISFVF